jgi:hypothetical protein
MIPRCIAASGSPAESKQKEVRYLDSHEDDPFDEAKFAGWAKHAGLPSERGACVA